MICHTAVNKQMLSEQLLYDKLNSLQPAEPLTSARHARLETLLKAAVATGVARARVDDAISGRLARVGRALDQSATKEFLKRAYK